MLRGRRSSGPFFAAMLLASGFSLRADAETRIARPEPAVDFSRLSNPALPPDLGLPHVEACVRRANGDKPAAGGRVLVKARFSEAGQVLDVEVAVAPYGETIAALPASIAPCVKARLAGLSLVREKGAAPITMAGRYVVLWGLPNLAADLVVYGRMREVEP